MNPAEFANIARAEQRIWWYRGMNRILDALLPPGTFRRVLDAGCGTGYLAQRLERLRGWPMYGVDLGAEGLVFARGLGVRRLAQGDLLRLPFRDASFDAATCMDVFVHLAPGQEQPAMDELARVLAPGGVLIFRVAAFNWLRSRHSEFVDEKQRYTRSQVLQLARRAGLTVLRSTYANMLLLPVAAAKFRVWEPLTRQAPASGVAHVNPALDGALYRCLAAESRLIGAGVDLPIGQTIWLLARK